MKIDKDYFLKEYHAFRAVLSSVKYTIKQKADAFEGLLTVYVNCECASEEEDELLKTAMSMLVLEVDMRLGLSAAMKIEKLLGEAIC